MMMMLCSGVVNQVRRVHLIIEEVRGRGQVLLSTLPLRWHSYNNSKHNKMTEWLANTAGENSMKKPPRDIFLFVPTKQSKLLAVVSGGDNENK